MKKIVLTLQDIFDLPSARIFNPDGYKPVSSVSIDTRKIIKDSLYIAIKGNSFDGHDFIFDAINKGASALMISEKRVKDFRTVELPLITVRDTAIALGNVAGIWRSKIKAKVVSITGSTGKTSTKELLSLMLNEKYISKKTEANNNNHIGVPLTLLSATNKDQVIIIEHGTNHFGEIPYTASIAQPDYAMITNVGHSHLEYLKNKNGVLKEKSSLFVETVKRGGKVFINNDDPLLKKISKKYIKKVTFGFEENPDVKGNIIGYNPGGCAITELRFRKKSFIYELPVAGKQGAKNFLSATAVALDLGIKPKQISDAIRKFKSIDKRLRIKKYRATILIDDTYNANPESMAHSIELLALMEKKKNKLAVLGDMFELGKGGVLFHQKLSTVILKNDINSVYTTGKLMKHLDEKLRGKKIVHEHFSNRLKLAEFLNTVDLSDSVILIKGSRGMKMEEFVKIIEGRF